MVFSFIEGYSVGDFALYSVVGLLIVILALALLVFLITMISKALNLEAFNGKKKEKPSAPTGSPASETVACGGDEELVAAITAAVYAFYEAEENETVPVPFVIKSIRKN